MMELIRVVGNILMGMAVVVIAFTTHKNPTKAIRFLFNCLFEHSKDEKNVSSNK